MVSAPAAWVRCQLVQVDAVILSSYPLNADRAFLKPLSSLTAGRMPIDAAKALLAVHCAVLAEGGDFRVTDAYRSPAEQAAAREKYKAWIAADQPSTSSPEFNKTTMKAAFVAIPGQSFHNAGRSIDADIASLRFPGVAADKQLDRLWEIATPLGWRPVIDKPTEGASESWHFDFMGVWAPVCKRRGYADAAAAAVMDIGVYYTGPVHYLQAHLHRAGYDVGAIDGDMGTKTRAGLTAAGLDAAQSPAALVPLVLALPSVE